MEKIPSEQVAKRIQAENIWWSHPHTISDTHRGYRQRAYFKPFFHLIQEASVNRAILLMGPRRVGKTVLIHHAIGKLIESGVMPKQICYLSVDHPLYTGCSLEGLINYFKQVSGSEESQRMFVFFDEIQYLKNWEIHLKTLVDQSPNIKFIASGSAAAALKLKSAESGAGRFTDFLLPPLTFHEYLDLQGKNDIVQLAGNLFNAKFDIEKLNEEFLGYVNFGGYPEVVFSKIIQEDPARYVKSDIIDKVLLRDLPSLYGIDDIQELNSLFTTLAYNTANEVSLEELSKNSGVAKNTIKRYIEYLEAAFLIKVVHRIDRSAKRFQRANFFKVYLTNPSMRSALFSPITAQDNAFGNLTETAIFSQWFHSSRLLYYARWKDGEVDIVGLGPDQKPKWAVEVKSADRCAEDDALLVCAVDFAKRNGITGIAFTTRSVLSKRLYRGIEIRFVPASLYCYALGHNLVGQRNSMQTVPPSA